MKLRKMITVYAAALMLAGVGASATSQMPSANASRRTVRVTRLNNQKSRLNRQIRRDQAQVKQINREMARLTHKNVRKGKRSKKTVKRRKFNKKANKKRNLKKVTRHNHNKKQAVNRRQPKLTPQQLKLLQQQEMQAMKQRANVRVAKGNEVYNATVNGLGGVISMKPYMSIQNYIHKIQGKWAKNVKIYNGYIKRFQKARSKKAKMNVIKSKKFQNAFKTLRSLQPQQLSSSKNAKK